MQGIKLNNKYYGIYKNTKYYGIKNEDLDVPLHFIALEDNSSVGYTITGTSINPDIKYSYDMNTWNSWDGTDITLNINDVVYIKGNNPNGLNISTANYVRFIMSGKIKASGNINSLLDNNCGNTITTVPLNCYVLLFYNCTSLIYPPTLPATTLEHNCYYGMFRGCSSLIEAPNLPATNLAEYCYYYMFYGCTSLVTAPDLPATTLAKYCYSYMFRGCTSLINAPTLPATTLINYCYYYMFAGCTSLINAPELPATTLVDDCYGYMFKDCTSLNYVKTAFTGDFRTSAGGWGGTYDYTTSWLSGVASTGDFYYNGETIRRGVSAIPTDWTVHTF